jgi:hypothetical protein
MGFMDGIQSGGAKYIAFDGKEAKYKVQGADTPLNGEQFVARIFEAAGGYIKFGGKDAQPDRRMGSVFPDDKAPDRKSLGDLKQSEWPRGKFSNEPEDPWRGRIEIPREQYILIAMSKTALGAMKDLLKQCSRLPQGYEPRIRLDTASFKGKFGTVKKPLLTITGKVAANGHAPEEQEALPFNDSVNF